VKLGYKYYRRHFIKGAIVTVGLLCYFWDKFHGRGNPNDEPAALILIAVTMVTANVGLFIAMRRAKRKEQEENTDHYSGTQTDVARK
jgi:F0F1-type ATP synthase assembly protein I